MLSHVPHQRRTQRVNFPWFPINILFSWDFDIIGIRLTTLYIKDSKEQKIIIFVLVSKMALQTKISYLLIFYKCKFNKMQIFRSHSFTFVASEIVSFADCSYLNLKAGKHCWFNVVLLHKKIYMSFRILHTITQLHVFPLKHGCNMADTAYVFCCMEQTVRQQKSQPALYRCNTDKFMRKGFPNNYLWK